MDNHPATFARPAHTAEFSNGGMSYARDAGPLARLSTTAHCEIISLEEHNGRFCGAAKSSEGNAVIGTAKFRPLSWSHSRHRYVRGPDRATRVFFLPA